MSIFETNGELLPSFYQPPVVPDWRGINQAHRQLEAEGLVSPNRLPAGAVPLEVAFSQIDMTLPVADLRPVRGPSNGFGGRSRTERVGIVSVSPHIARSRIEDYETGVERQIEDIVTGEDYRRSGYRWTYDPDTDQETYDFDPELAVRRAAEEYDAHVAKLPAITAGIVAEQPYAKGLGSRPTAEELARAERTLAWDSQHRRQGKPKVRKTHQSNGLR